MPETTVDWIPALVMLGIGLAIGLVVMFRLRPAPKKNVVQPLASLEIRDLEGKRDSLIRQLQEMEDTAVKRTPEQLAAERYTLELEAAEVLREIDRTATELAAAAPVDEDDEELAAPAPARPVWMTFATGLFTAGAIAFLVLFVMRSASERAEGGSVTGGFGNPAPAAAVGEDLTPLLQQVEQNPEDLDARLQLAWGYLMQRNLMEVYNQTQYVLERSPGNPRALSYQALVRLAMGQPEAAEAMLKQAIQTQPELLDAWVHLSLVYAQTGRMDDARNVIQDAIRQNPDQREVLESIVAELEGAAAMQETAASAQAPAPPAGAPAATASAAGTSPAGSVAGTIMIDQAAASRLRAGSALFITARSAGQASGPPVAAKRLVPQTFPLAFQLSASDSMTGQPLPEKLRLDAWIDSDGDAMTRDPQDLTGSIDNVQLQASDLSIVLR